MVVRGEERAARHALRQLLQHRGGNGRAVEGRRAAAQLVENGQGAPARVGQNSRGLLQLREQRALALQQRVVGPDPREDAVHRAESARGRVHAAADLRHDDGDARLPQHRGLAAHVGARHDQAAGHAPRVQEGVVGHEGAAHLRCHNGVSALHQLERPCGGGVADFHNVRLAGAPMQARRGLCQGQHGIQLRQQAEGRAELRLIGMELLEELAQERKYAVLSRVLGVLHLLHELLYPVGLEAHLALVAEGHVHA
mmetsp:Transcript_86702/g.226278  ORF Transcript_86702/g.226278 Transcript_86702/m.226278 type:complete len:254 (-) Transcript_86702:1164-1925(-)